MLIKQKWGANILWCHNESLTKLHFNWNNALTFCCIEWNTWHALHSTVKMFVTILQAYMHKYMIYLNAVLLFLSAVSRCCSKKQQSSNFLLFRIYKVHLPLNFGVKLKIWRHCALRNQFTESKKIRPSLINNLFFFLHSFCIFNSLSFSEFDDF